MKYFVGRGIYTFNSGAEHAQAQRTLLFNAHHNAAKYVTRDYNRLAAHDGERMGLDADTLLNMYDYFQGTLDVERQEIPLRGFKAIPLDEYQVVDHGPNYATLNQAGRELARVNILPGTVGLVGDIEYYDRFENSISRENYDWRGFKSSVDYFHPNGELAVRRFLNLSGDVVLEQTFMNIEGQLQPSMWKLLNHRGRDYRFDTENQLFLFFLNEVMQSSTDNVIVSEQRDLDYVVADIQNTVAKWIAFHGSHLDQGGTPYAVYAMALQVRAKDFDGIIVPTQAQKAQLEAEFPNLTVVTAPDVMVKTTNVLPLEQRVGGRVIFSGRLENDKRPMETLQAFLKLLKWAPNATLEFHGYTNDSNLLTEMRQLIDERGIQKQVILGEYLTSEAMTDFYSRAQVLVNTSMNEALGMQMVEAMSYGVPVVTYDIQFGTHTLIENGVNGYIVTNGDQAQMARRLKQILSDKQLWLQMSQAAYQKAQEYEIETVYQQWYAILK